MRVHRVTRLMCAFETAFWGMLVSQRTCTPQLQAIHPEMLNCNARPQ